MKKPKHMPIKSQLRPKKTPVVELALYIIFYTVRFILYSVFRGIGTDAKMSLDMTVLITSSIIVGYIFSQFLLFFVIWSLLTENMYGYCLSVVMMLHNFLITGIVIVQHWNNQCIAVKYWLSGILISASYIVEVCVSTFLFTKDGPRVPEIYFKR
ncbi:uncharacterized protein VICG_01846 [Vittaforma corneae ATCC 50505]|uniref:Uncharacterized protein n=1 Tax=Vittaforma corneae (strain ATCC 50505) TaxID=993615 RepID=L2GLJ6_VITCO|nr:uncharacterized protein VICG_01846 [Vittaforma corneae ATCC 50505]ELA41147.1 hypothetical protein VICG_01846 [Vittaforma corneae ATCC 50505]